MTEPETIRLQKLIADEGLASRREAEIWIRDGRVDVNGQTASLGQKVDPLNDKIKIDGRSLRPKTTRPKITLALNKPKGFLCSNEDPFHNKLVFDLLPKLYAKERLFCAGRLDKDSEGLIILTNDGDLANKITHPSQKIIKRYQVTLSRPIDPKHIPLLIKGVKDEGELLYALKVIPQKTGFKKELRVEVHLEQGRKREIRRLFERFGYFVDRLKRIQIGSFTLKGIPKGTIKKLSSQEISLLLQPQFSKLNQ